VANPQDSGIAKKYCGKSADFEALARGGHNSEGDRMATVEGCENPKMAVCGLPARAFK
jgi:hypothetical protein